MNELIKDPVVLFVLWVFAIGIIFLAAFLRGMFAAKKRDTHDFERHCSNCGRLTGSDRVAPECSDCFNSPRNKPKWIP
jgi:hypothetical protein